MKPKKRRHELRTNDLATMLEQWGKQTHEALSGRAVWRMRYGIHRVKDGSTG